MISRAVEFLILNLFEALEIDNDFSNTSSTSCCLRLIIRFSTFRDILAYLAPFIPECLLLIQIYYIFTCLLKHFP